MKPDRPTSAILFLGTLGAGLLLAAVGVIGGLGDGPLVPAAAELSLVDGSLASEVEDVVEERHALREPAVTLLAATRYALFGDASGPAVAGSDEWLFTLEELERRPGDDERLARRIAEIERTARRLESAGIDLLVAIVPAKARVAAGRLPRRWRALARHPRLDTALDALGSRDVPVVDLRPALTPTDDVGEELFFARDTHWTPAGARRAAEAVSQYANQTGIAPAGSAYVRAEGDPADVPGDLMSFVPVGPLREAFDLAVERSVPARAEPAPGSESGGGGLFGEIEIPVALVGTSYSRDERWGFAEELKLALDADVLNVASEGEGPFAPMREYLASETIRDPKPQLVVWEIPERYLTLPSPRSGAPAPGSG